MLRSVRISKTASISGIGPFKNRCLLESCSFAHVNWALYFGFAALGSRVTRIINNAAVVVAAAIAISQEDSPCPMVLLKYVLAVVLCCALVERRCLSRVGAARPRDRAPEAPEDGEK